MKLNPRSWHYRLWKSSFGHGQRLPAHVGLCDYFWRIVRIIMGWVGDGLVALLLLCLGLAFFGAIVAVGLLCLKGLSAGSAYVAHQQVAPDAPAASWLTALYFVLSVATIVGAIWAVRHARAGWEAVAKSDTVQLTVNYLKAKKEGVCPVLEVPEAGKVVD